MCETTYKWHPLLSLMVDSKTFNQLIPFTDDFARGLFAHLLPQNWDRINRNRTNNLRNDEAHQTSCSFLNYFYNISHFDKCRPRYKCEAGCPACTGNEAKHADSNRWRHSVVSEGNILSARPCSVIGDPRLPFSPCFDNAGLWLTVLTVGPWLRWRPSLRSGKRNSEFLLKAHIIFIQLGEL